MHYCTKWSLGCACVIWFDSPMTKMKPLALRPKWVVGDEMSNLCTVNISSSQSLLPFQLSEAGLADLHRFFWFTWLFMLVRQLLRRSRRKKFGAGELEDKLAAGKWMKTRNSYATPNLTFKKSLIYFWGQFNASSCTGKYDGAQWSFNVCEKPFWKASTSASWFQPLSATMVWNSTA